MLLSLDLPSFFHPHLLKGDVDFQVEGSQETLADGHLLAGGD